MVDAVAPQVQTAQPLQLRKVFQSREVIVGQVDGVELIARYGQVLDGGYGEGAQEDLPLAEGVGALFGRLEDVGGEAHGDMLLMIGAAPWRGRRCKLQADLSLWSLSVVDGRILLLVHLIHSAPVRHSALSSDTFPGNLLGDARAAQILCRGRVSQAL